MAGEVPQADIDHINQDRTDNRFCNLRVASRSENKANVGLRSDNVSGYKGISYVKARRLWQATISRDGKAKYLGRFARKENAALAYNFAAFELFGEYACFNRG